MFDHADLLLGLSRALAENPRADRWPALCRAAVRGLRVDDGSIALSVAGVPEMLCASSRRAAAYGQAQEICGEGPVHDVLATSAPVLVTGGDGDLRRWPRLGALYGTVEAGPVVAVPMTAQPTEVVGVLTIHHGLRSSLGRHLHGGSDEARADALADVLFVADTLGAVVLADTFLPEDEQLRWIDRDRVAQAVGMVVAQTGGTPEDALALIRARAFADGVTVAEVSRRVVSRELDLGRGEGGPDGSGPR
ncbi:ANTAR domain-containing protein [uncultured Nocardioides sp.]|uniref:ANTAR domain-containing protein n=1 Tax=uncultured Nocardioides sp. TaxID=198441 RepID=UPI0026096C15|nr:ANTAR domain-containing protein [uncultured Nocardioides sp.]